jgi:hypothetical protein
VVFKGLLNQSITLGACRGTQWSNDIRIAKVSTILDIVGIWNSPINKHIYILRKHPGLSLLTAEERGQRDIIDESI